MICSRFEPDMLAFAGCDYGGGEKERRELGAIKKRWKTLHVSYSEHLGLSVLGLQKSISKQIT